MAEEHSYQIGELKQCVGIGDRYKIAFWSLIIFILGFIAGIFYAQDIIIGKRLKDSTRLGGIVIENKVYDMKERL